MAEGSEDRCVQALSIGVPSVTAKRRQRYLHDPSEPFKVGQGAVSTANFPEGVPQSFACAGTGQGGHAGPPLQAPERIPWRGARVWAPSDRQAQNFEGHPLATLQLT